jgi:formylglycine-generating enzyme required for sulfatase activity
MEPLVPPNPSMASPSPAASFTPPAEFDDYVIVRPLGAGRMGQVYLAEDTVLARAVAIKFIAGVPDLGARRRFLLEARATARIQHPNVVSVYRVGEVSDRPYLVSELIRGRPLSELPKPRPWAEVLTLGLELARGLAAAHRRGVVHCDVTPKNVMVTDDGVPKLVDFGLARVVQDRDVVVGGLVGTPDYMAPEVWAGQAPSRRSDVYSLGAVLFELCVGQAPFAAVAAGELAAVVSARSVPTVVASAPATDPRLAAIIDRCLGRDPADRYPSGEELRDALEQLVRQRDASATPSGNPYRGLRPFEASHRAMFFGRSLEVGALVERLRTDAMVIVAGDSGVGKSSLCRAGVVPAIIDGAIAPGQTWDAITIVPGAHPLTTLATALDAPSLVDGLAADPELLARALHRRAGTGGLVLFIDQLEELITLGPPAEVVALAAGLARLADGIAGVRVVATARADFLSRLAALPHLGPELARLLYFVAPLPPERLREVIVGPALVVGVRFASEAMVTTLVEATAAAGSGALPLLSFALAALWAERDVAAGVIGEDALAAVGGVDGALARHADAVLGGLPIGGRAVARRILARLVTTVGTRVRRGAAELVTEDAGRVVLEALVRGRLLVIHDDHGAPLYELAHEVLVTGWATLREWLELDAENRARRERLAAAALEWRRLGQPREATWRGRQLAEARALGASELTDLERDFVRASVRGERRRRWLVRGLAVAAVALAAGGYAGLRWQAQRRVDAMVAGELRAARAARAQAEVAVAVDRAASAEAFAAFERGDDATGEVAWRRARAARAQADRELRELGSRLEAALARDPSRADVRALLVEALLDRATLAEQHQAFEVLDEMLARVPVYDQDGARLAEWRRPGRLAFTAPPGTAVTIAPGDRALPAAPAEVELAPGTYQLTARGADGAMLTAPVAIRRGERIAIDLTPPPPSAVPPGFAFVPAGTVDYGAAASDEQVRSFFLSPPMHPRHVDAFAIAVHEVTIADWLRFVEAQPPQQQAALVPRAEAGLGSGGPLALTRTARGWHLMIQPADRVYQADWGEPIVYPGRARLSRQDWRRFPVTAITATDAEAYAAWLATTGQVPGARLCTELEWTRAARGADGRNYPSGSTIELGDANFDATHGLEHMGPDEVGSHPGSVSVFGVHDLVGNAYEWARTAAGDGYVALGGSFFHDRLTAHLANRNLAVPSLRVAVVGLRLCATPRLR